MKTLVRKEEPDVFVEIGVHTDMEITLDWDNTGPRIHIGDQQRTMMVFADVESLERLASVAADGARRFQERIADEAGAA